MPKRTGESCSSRRAAQRGRAEFAGALLVAALLPQLTTAEPTPVWTAEPDHAVSSASTPARSPHTASPDESAEPRRYLLGDWGGGRSWLEDHGVTPGVVYTLDLFGTPRGGNPRYQPFSAFGNLELSVEVDTETAGGWQGGRFLVHARNLIGANERLNRRLFEPFDPVSEFSVGQTTQISNLFFEQQLLGERLVMKVGKQDASMDFAVSDAAGAFLNAGIEPAANVPMPAFPFPSLGLTLLGDLSPEARWAGGIFGSDFDGNALTDSGLFKGKVFAIGQLAFDGQIGNVGGTTTLGAWYRHTPPPGNYAGPPTNGAYGIYLLIEQRLISERPGGGGDEGLSGFFQISWTPADQSNFDLWVGGGLVYRGLLPGRGQDVAGIAALRAGPSPAYERLGFSREVVIECFYEWHVTPWLSFRPDFQYFSRSAGTPNSVAALGLRTVIDF